ncbi:hypothetical protein MHSWG343_07530 [Candidatus Mycoplasma haematohominis]|uniref:Uncharacterized protein n=1 Tax=Candidatus Mycoplasma haematohominis TaxID=1494318 RepID=A0A478FQL4_9MOLU|nr:hypothetical protein MHSWG343_07530 [Candidatus Mycoplasma haemohominis]
MQGNFPVPNFSLGIPAPLYISVEISPRVFLSQPPP